MVKFWPSRSHGKVVCGWAKFLAPPYYSQRAVFVSPPSAFFSLNYTIERSFTVFIILLVLGRVVISKYIELSRDADMVHFGLVRSL